MIGWGEIQRCFMVKLAFYKNKSTLFNRAVSWWTNGPYSHVELIIDGVSYSSSFRDGGVRKKLIDYKPEHWDMFELNCTAETEQNAVAWFEQNMGRTYDVLGLVGFVIGSVSGDKEKFFCSEAVASALGYNETWRFDPNDLAAIVKHVSQQVDVK